ncbi:TniB family NTP-binding protein [Pseudarthrobacter sp. BRE9]|uniref:TniB family NTP-binding protein n=1 Tax=Pseudarthrobacter sp. BRE9 TaxID=2962582 RepID=UPI00288174CA|nr:TniB family NTP-binding protein [Pseudarthrobacter sp. BRE9]MDT0168871.1 TniB family NTP-binding protein [Pseudarthrobacter sp. BRE9]
MEELQDHGTPTPPVAVKEYLSLPLVERKAFDETRRKIITRGVVVKNDSYLNVRAVLVRVMREHQYASGGGHGVLVSAESYLGKTTVARILMLDLLTQRLDNDPDCIRRGEVPVAYVNLPSTGTPLGLYRMIAQFYGLPIGQRETEARLEGMVQQAINTCKTELLVIDDVHNLKYGGAHSRKVSAAIRRLGDDIDCPILLAGIELQKTNLLEGPEGAQIAARYRAADMVSYEDKNSTGWQMLVTRLVRSMPLFGNNQCRLKTLSASLHELTNGRIGVLNSLVSRVALDLIDAGNPEGEVLTRGMAEAKAAEIAEEGLFKAAIRHGAVDEL